MIVSYIKEVNSFIEYAAEQNISANERTFYHTLLFIINRRSNGSDFPTEFVSITNRQMLLYLPYSENSLIKARARLLSRDNPIIEYLKGYKNETAPKYKINYFSLRGGGKEQVKREVKRQVNEGVKRQTYIKTKDLDLKTKDLTNITAVSAETVKVVPDADTKTKKPREKKEIVISPNVLEFWNEYPNYDGRRLSKKEIEKYYRKEKFTDDDHKKIMKALRIYKKNLMARSNNYNFVMKTAKWFKEYDWQSINEIEQEQKQAEVKEKKGLELYDFFD